MNDSFEDDDARIQHEDDLLTLCTAIEEYKETVDILQRENLALSTRNNQLASQNEALVVRESEHISSINALEESLMNLLEELDITGKQLSARDDDIQSLQACLNAIHRRKIDVDDLTKQQQAELIEKLQIENQLLSSSKKSNKELVTHYDEIINNKNSEILDLKCIIREMEAEKREYLNSFKRKQTNDSSDDEKTEQKENHKDNKGIRQPSTTPSNSAEKSYKDKINMLSDFGSALLSSTSKPSSATKKEPGGRHSEIHNTNTNNATVDNSGTPVKLREVIIDSSVTHDKLLLPAYTSNPVRRTPPRSKTQQHLQHRHQQLNSSYSEDEYHSNKQAVAIAHRKNRNTSSRSSRAFSSADDDDDDADSDGKSPVELTIRKAASAIRNNKKNRQESQWRALQQAQSNRENEGGLTNSTSWQDVNKHANLFTEAKVFKSSVNDYEETKERHSRGNQSEEEFENILIPFDKPGQKHNKSSSSLLSGSSVEPRKNSKGVLIDGFMTDNKKESERSNVITSKYAHK